MRNAILLLSLCLALVGCQSLTLQKPIVSLTNTSIGGVSREGVTVLFDLDVKNPNAVALPLSKVKYKLALANQTMLDDTLEPDSTIAASASTPVRVPIVLKFDRLEKVGTALMQTGGDVPFALDANLSLGGGAGLFASGVSAPVRFTGTLPLKSALSDPKTLLTSPAARALARKLFGL